MSEAARIDLVDRAPLGYIARKMDASRAIAIL